MNRLYIVVSETLYDPYPPIGVADEPPEPYGICELVIARNPAQARMVAAKHADHDYDGDPLNLPRISVHQLSRNMAYPRGTIVSDWKCFREWWGHPKVAKAFVARALWDAGTKRSTICLTGK